MSVQKSTSGSPYLDLLVIAYGSSSSDPNDDSRFTGETQRRIEVKLTPQIPADIAGNMRRMQIWVRDTVTRVALDIKHTQRWHCEFCDKLARESQTNICPWLHLTPPRVIVYLHLVCNSIKGPCADQIHAIGRQMAAMSGGPAAGRVAEPVHIFTGDAVYPAAASCTKCEREETVNLNMSRCAGCKVSRYCSIGCQKEDWARHKLTCKAVRDVKWVWT